MANDVLRMKEEEFEVFTSGLQKNSTGFSSTESQYKKDFQNLVNTGLTGDSVGKIGNQMVAITNSISNVRNIIQKHSNQMFSFDRSVAKKIEDIDIPQDFVANDASSINYYTQTLLGKIDGQSVNEGHESHMFKEIDDSVVNAEKLTDIRGTDSKEEKYDARSSISSQSILGNISGDTTQEQHYDSSSSVSKAAMENISGNVTEQQHYDETSVVGKSILGDITSGATQKRDYEDGTGGMSVAALGDITSKESRQVSFDDLHNEFTSSVNNGFAAANVGTKEVHDREKEDETIVRVSDKYSQ